MKAGRAAHATMVQTKENVQNHWILRKFELGGASQTISFQTPCHGGLFRPGCSEPLTTLTGQCILMGSGSSELWLLRISLRKYVTFRVMKCLHQKNLNSWGSKYSVWCYSAQVPIQACWSEWKKKICFASLSFELNPWSFDKLKMFPQTSGVQCCLMTVGSGKSVS